MFRIFIDSNIFIQGGKPPGGPIVSRIEDLAKAQIIEVLTTDLTVTEVAKKHTENDYNVIKELGSPHFQNLAKKHIGLNLPELNKDELRASIFQEYLKEVELMFNKLNARTLAIDNVKPSNVFKAYGDKSSFFSGKGKKDQFPDAFIFECLKAEASADSPVIIVSLDNDFESPVESENNISLVKDLPTLFKNLGLQVEAPEIEEFLIEKEAELLKLCERELIDFTLYASDVMDADIEIDQVLEVVPVELISFSFHDKDDRSILVVGTLKITTQVYYTHPDWGTASYDSEDKVLIPWDEVAGETEVTLYADFSMTILTDDESNPVQIDDFLFRNDDFTFIDLYPSELYK
ncbi:MULTISPECIES: PIN domain-containing protein [unclassified Nitrospina]|uniref:PIN domain-containing protein n=1 Tax=unclassified Nitrospina TaxID=2638683 RepID=UPI003F980672